MVATCDDRHEGLCKPNFTHAMLGVLTIKSSAHVERRLAEFMDFCQTRGLKVTQQRTEILRELVTTDNHPDVETLYLRVRQRIPSISLDTVYRTLRTFEEEGVITRIGPQLGRTRYDANSEPHHHFVCLKCGHVEDVFGSTLEGFKLPKGIERIGRFDTIYVELRGVCFLCQGKEKQ